MVVGCQLVGKRELIEDVTFVGLNYEEDTEMEWGQGFRAAIFDVSCRDTSRKGGDGWIFGKGGEVGERRFFCGEGMRGEEVAVTSS